MSENDWSDNPGAYWAKVCDARANDANVDDMRQGKVLISAETQQEFSEQDIGPFIHGHFDLFLKYLRYLQPSDQELLMSYYLVKATQEVLTHTGFTETQTALSRKIRHAVRSLCLFMIFGGPPTESQIATILTDANQEHVELGARQSWHTEPDLPVKAKISEIIAIYVETGDFADVAFRLKIHRPALRRALGYARDALLESQIASHRALGSWLERKIDKAAPSGTGKTKRASKKECGTVFRSDPDFADGLGFRIDVGSPEFAMMFVPKNIDVQPDD